MHVNSSLLQCYLFQTLPSAPFLLALPFRVLSDLPGVEVLYQKVTECLDLLPPKTLGSLVVTCTRFKVEHRGLLGALHAVACDKLMVVEEKGGG